MFHGLLLVTGSVLSLTNRMHDLGIALVVGSLFAAGAFGAQVWAVTAERQRLIREATLGLPYFYGDLFERGDELRRATAVLERSDDRTEDRLPIFELGIKDIRERLR
jgi:hypothetical protein